MLLLLSDSDFNVRQELFAQNEQGAYYDPTLSESARTWRRNLLSYTGNLTNSYWSPVNATIASSGSGPLTTTPEAFLLTATSTTGILRKAWTLTVPSLAHTISFYAKAGTSGWCAIRFNAFDTSPPVYFNLTNGTVGTVSVLLPANSASIESVGNGWYRCIVTNLSSTTDLSGNLDIHVTAADNSLSTVGGESVYLTGIQFELGSATPYQPITDWITEFKAAFPTHCCYTDSTGVTPAVAPGDSIGLILDQRQGALSNLGPELWTNPIPTITNNSGTVGAYDSGTLTMTNSGSTVAGYPRFAFELGAVSGRRYRIAGRLAGDLSAVGSVRLATATDAQATCSFNSSTGDFSGLVVASATSLQFLTTLTSTQAITIASLSVREVPGNHAYQTSGTARPALARVPFGGRRNLLQKSEEFDTATWLRNNLNVTANAATSPSGSMADLCIPTVDNTTHFIRQISLPSNTYTFSCYLKAAGETQVSLWLASASAAGIFTLTGSGSYTGAGGLSAASIEHVGDGWYLCQVWHNVAGTTVHVYGRAGSAYIGNGTDGFYIADAQAEATASLSRTNYQKSAGAGAVIDVTENGQPDCWALYFDGSDDHLLTNAIDFAGWTQTTRRNLLLDTDLLGTWTQTNTLNGSWTAGVATVSDVEGYTYGNQNGTFSTTTDHVISFDVTCNQTVSDVPIRVAGTTNVTTLANLSAGVTTRITLTGYRPFAGSVQVGMDLRNAVVPGGSNTTGYTLTFSRIQLEAGTVATDYQRVGTDEMTVIAGARKLIDSSVGIVAELSADTGGNNGTWYVLAGPPSGTGARWTYSSKGTTVRANQTPANYAAPITNVITGQSDISGDVVYTRANGVEVASNLLDQGTGNYGNYVLYLGRRGGSTVPFNGLLHHLIIRGATTSGSKLTGAEKLTGKKSGLNI